MIGLSPFISIGLSLLLLLGAGVVVRYVFDLVKQARTLTVALKRANDRLQDAAIEIRVGSQTASERVSKLGRKRSPSR